MKQSNFTGPEERRGYSRGYAAGFNEGMKKAAMLIQLVATNTEDFEENILQNSKEAKRLREIFTDM